MKEESKIIKFHLSVKRQGVFRSWQLEKKLRVQKKFNFRCLQVAKAMRESFCEIKVLNHMQTEEERVQKEKDSFGDVPLIFA
jgi:hypothetical protein